MSVQEWIGQAGLSSAKLKVLYSDLAWTPTEHRERYNIESMHCEKVQS